MTDEELSALTDEKLMQVAKKQKWNATINAFLVGFVIAVVIWGVVNSTSKLLMLIPLFIIYKLVNSSEDDKALKRVLEERNLN